MKREFSVRSGFFHEIKGVIDTPKGSGPFPVIVICHGFTGHKDQDLYVTLSRVLVEHGFAALRFDFTINVDNGISTFHPASEMHDLKMVIDFLGSVPELDQSRISIVGHSYGATVLLLYASRDSRIKAVVSLSAKLMIGDAIDIKHSWGREANEKGWFSHITSDKRHLRISREFLEENLQHQSALMNALLDIRAPTLVVYGNGDREDDILEGELLYKSLRCRKERFVLQGGDHAYRRPLGGQRTVGIELADFLHRYV